MLTLDLRQYTENLPALSNNKIWQISYLANEIRLTVANTLGTNQDELQKEIVVYPNPAANTVFFENLPTSIHTYTIFSILGETIQQGSIQHNTIDVSRLTTGNYYIKMGSDVFPLLKQ